MNLMHSVRKLIIQHSAIAIILGMLIYTINLM